MSTPKDADDVKLVVSLFSPEEQILEEAIQELQAAYGPTDWVSPPLFFDRTRYYEKEMGWPLHRRFVSIKRLIQPEEIVDVKLRTNELEKRHLREGRRKVNLDPGYVALERLVLATGKNYTHRIHLSKGIYADLTLIFHQGSFQALAWTYRDYADPVVIG
ncbi:MAG: DUF4416 family protein, partial [Deltaproteobacteria bacterium]